jgi:hypothetical protein
MHCIYISISYLHIMIDHTEQGRVEPPEPALVEALTTSKSKVSPGASNHNP